MARNVAIFMTIFVVVLIALIIYRASQDPDTIAIVDDSGRTVATMEVGDVSDTILEHCAATVAFARSDEGEYDEAYDRWQDSLDGLTDADWGWYMAGNECEDVEHLWKDQ